MKNLFALNFVFLFSTMTLIIACNGSHKSSSSKSESSEKPLLAPQVLVPSLISSSEEIKDTQQVNLPNLILNSEDRTGEIIIRDEDAKVLYNHMAAKEKKESNLEAIGLTAQVVTEVRRKKGYDLSCWTINMKTNPSVSTYKCAFKIDHYHGKIGWRTLFVENARAAILTRDYNGQSVSMKVANDNSKPKSKATLIIRAEAARALFFSMENKQDNLPSGDHIVNRGDDIVCTRKETQEMSAEKKAEYFCEVVFDYTNGRAISQKI